MYRSATTGGPYNKLSTVTSGTLRFTDSTPVAGQHYFYVITAVAADGAESLASNEVAVVIPTP